MSFSSENKRLREDLEALREKEALLLSALAKILKSSKADPNRHTSGAGKWVTLNVRAEVVEYAQTMLHLTIAQRAAYYNAIQQDWVDAAVTYGTEVLLGKYPASEELTLASFIAELRWALRSDPPATKVE